MELIIGSHVSFSKEEQLLGSVKEALSYDANTFMFYTGAPQNTTRLPINMEMTQKAHDLMLDNNIDINNVVIHAPYIVNLANKENHDFGIKFLKEEIHRSKVLGIKRIVLHPGSHVGQGKEIGLKNIIDALNQIIDEETREIICLETMAGKGSELGSTFEEIKTIIDGVKYNEQIGVCLDTCHINDAGYDIKQFDKVLEEFDKVIGISKLQCIHINDSKNVINSHKDRHENFGQGEIGFDNLINIIYNEKIKSVPKILETPYVTKNATSLERTYPPYKFEIASIRLKKQNSNLIEEIRSYYK